MQRMWRMCGRSMASGVMVSGLLCALLALAGCQFAIGPLSLGPTPTPSLPTLPSGWTWYHDSVYPFDAPITPGWQAHGYWNDLHSGDRCQRKVDLVPPVSQASYRSDPERLFEFISIVVVDTCPDFVPARDNQHLSPVGTGKVDGVSATLYTEIDEAGNDHVAITRFGGRQYIFTFYYEYGTATPQSGAKAEIGVFNTLLKDFNYHGK